MDAFFGVLLLASVYHGSQEALQELWSRPSGRSIFLATMSVKRFKMLLRFCRFDNKATRGERRAVDKLAAFRDVWTTLVVQLRKFCIQAPTSRLMNNWFHFVGDVHFDRIYQVNQPGVV